MLILTAIFEVNVMEEFSSKDMDHLGLVAGMCDELGLVNLIDQVIPPDPRAKLSTGECIKLMIINGLGFSSRPLYLEAQFFSSKPIKRLLGRELSAEDISDDSLGRALDRLYTANCEHIFSTIASKAITHFNVNPRFRHLDTTSMSVHGEYEEGIGLIEFGYSKDNNPNLKQFMVSLMSSQDGDVPLLAQTIAGNISDKKHFRSILKSLKKEIQESDISAYYVADSALYTRETIDEISRYTKWVTRVPENIKASKELIKGTLKEEMLPCGDGYFYREIESNYANVKQRWMIVFSEKAYEKESKNIDKKILKAEEKHRLELKKLCRREYSCQSDALKDLKRFEKSLKYHNCHFKNLKEKASIGKSGRPKKTEKKKIAYQIDCELERSKEKISKILITKGKFIIATNELDVEVLTSEDLLGNYKKQQSVERGFRFLKDSTFMTSSVFLKKEQRIIALGCIMCLCLLVYMLCQRKLRLSLNKNNETIPNQKGKPIKNPTMKWIYQIFEGIHILYRQTNFRINEIVLNLNAIRIKVLRLMGPLYQKIYENTA